MTSRWVMDTGDFARRGLSRGSRGIDSPRDLRFHIDEQDGGRRDGLAPAPTQAACHVAIPAVAGFAPATSLTHAASQPDLGTVAPPTKEALEWEALKPTHAR